ncbi:hypothetical protein [Burkholderia stagnalis]
MYVRFITTVADSSASQVAAAMVWLMGPIAVQIGSVQFVDVLARLDDAAEDTDDSNDGQSAYCLTHLNGRQAE